jgi:hypothetical protein
MRSVALVGILASTTILSGCAGTVAGVSFSSISSFAGFASTLFTGADLGEHAVSLVTGKDCRFSEGLVRADRDICEERGSAATRDDFHGIFIERVDADGTVVYAAPKYMPARVGAGENENDPDQIWAQIKAAKAQEEGERQLARAEAAQQIDVAALATGSVSSDSLAFLPADSADGDTASQTAQRPRAVVNASAKREAPPMTASPAPADTDQPAIDVTSFTSTARSTGEGGPLIPTSGSTPVSSRLINGEPVVILRLRPMMSAAQSAAIETAVAMPTELPVEEISLPSSPPAKFAGRPSTSARSPQAILTDVPPARPSLPATTTTRVAQVESAAAVPPPARPRTKPAEVTPAVAKPAAATATRKPTEAFKPQLAPEDAAFDAQAPVQVPADVPAAPTEPAPTAAAAFAEPPAAEPAPSPLIPMQQE